MEIPDATLLVSTWSSKCKNCGKSCNPSSKTHDVILGYGDENGSPGCGIEWTHIFSEYVGERAEAATRDMRPDLEYIPHDFSRIAP